MDFFDYCGGLTMTNQNFADLFHISPRGQDEQLETIHMDLAASIQKVTETIVLTIAKNLSAETGQRNLCLSGGVALNCVANGALKKSGFFDNIWVQPASVMLAEQLAQLC